MNVTASVLHHCDFTVKWLSVPEFVLCGAESSLQWQWSVRGNRLELGPLTLSHAGSYTCLAKNSDGEAQRDYTLTVQGNNPASPCRSR